MAGCNGEAKLVVYPGSFRNVHGRNQKTPGSSTSIIRGLTKSLGIVAGFFCLIMYTPAWQWAELKGKSSYG